MRQPHDIDLVIEPVEFIFAQLKGSEFDRAAAIDHVLICLAEARKEGIEDAAGLLVDIMKGSADDQHRRSLLLAHDAILKFSACGKMSTEKMLPPTKTRH